MGLCRHRVVEGVHGVLEIVTLAKRVAKLISHLNLLFFSKWISMKESLLQQIIANKMLKIENVSHMCGCHHSVDV